MSRNGFIFALEIKSIKRTRLKIISHDGDARGSDGSSSALNL